MRLINVGFNNMIAADRVIALITPDSSPAKRLIQEARENGRVLDCTCGRKTRCVVVTDSDHVILSAIQPETIAGRVMSDTEKENRASDDSDETEE